MVSKSKLPVRTNVTEKFDWFFPVSLNHFIGNINHGFLLGFDVFIEIFWDGKEDQLYFTSRFTLSNF